MIHPENADAAIDQLMMIIPDFGNEAASLAETVVTGAARLAAGQAGNVRRRHRFRGRRCPRGPSLSQGIAPPAG